MRKTRGFLALLVVWAVLTPVGVRAGGDWNDGAIAWRPVDEGLALAKKDKKPACLVFYTDSCPHCTNYAKVFHDPRVVERAKRFVMIRQENGKDAAVTARYAPDGAYIPRTFFLSAAGELDASIHAPREKYQYFYDENDPAGLLAGMDEALRKLK